jgi:hypothetical protein
MHLDQVLLLQFLDLTQGITCPFSGYKLENRYSRHGEAPLANPAATTPSSSPAARKEASRESLSFQQHDVRHTCFL